MVIAAANKRAEKSTTPVRAKTVHIDTSLQIERCKEPRKRETVERALEGFDFTSTSTYARFEFKCAWVKDLAYLYAESQSIERPEELLSRVHEKLGAHPFHRNRLSRCIEGIVKYLSRVPGNLPYEVALLRFRAHILNGIMGAYPWWEQSTHHEYNGTHCVRATEPPKKHAGGRIDMTIHRCKPKDIRCRLSEFFEQHRKRFCAIKLAIEALGDKASKELLKAKELIQIAEKNPRSLCDDSKCRSMGDVLIAVDGGDMDYFAANNDKEWILLAEVLGKELINPVRDAKAVRQNK